MSDSLINRLEEIREDLGMNQIKFSEVLGVTPQNYNGWLKGKFKPKVEVFLNLHERWPAYNLEWLLTGTGLMKKGLKIKENILLDAEVNYGQNKMLAEKMISIFEYALAVLKENEKL